MAKKKSRKRKHNPSHKKSHRRRRRNPGLGMGNIGKTLKDLLPLMAGMAATAALVKRLPATETPAETPSILAGERWSMAQYAGAAGVAILGGKFASKVGLNGQLVSLGALGLIAAKALFTEVVPRIPGAATILGAEEGEIQDDNGQLMIYQGGRWQAMQGLVQMSPMDGLVERSPLDGTDEDDDSLGYMPAVPNRGGLGSAARDMLRAYAA